MPLPATIEDAKAAMRRDMIARRDGLPVAERHQAAETIAGRTFPVAVPPGTMVSGYMPLKSEISPIPLMKALLAAGATLALPSIAGRGKPLLMRAYAFGDALDAGMWGILQPKAVAAEIEPDVLIVPLLAFDRRGHRLGYGAGYYDMTVDRLRGRKPVAAIGIAFAAQEVEQVPATERDARLDLVLTERETIDCRGA